MFHCCLSTNFRESFWYSTFSLEIDIEFWEYDEDVETCNVTKPFTVYVTRWFIKIIYFLKALAGLVEIPAIALAIFIIMKVGKKWIFCATFFLAGISCLCSAIAEGKDDLEWLKITLLMIGKLNEQLTAKIVFVTSWDLISSVEFDGQLTKDEQTIISDVKQFSLTKKNQMEFHASVLSKLRLHFYIQKLVY